MLFSKKNCLKDQRTILNQKLYLLDNKNKPFNFGFTLAEVLITLGIIGIVAQMTIPTLMNNVQETTWKVGFKKNYSELSSAATFISMDPPETWTEYGMVTEFAKHIQTIKVCDTKKSIEEGCWESSRPIVSKAKVLNAADAGSWGGGATCMRVINGSVICFDLGSTTSPVLIDVNGAKPPNTIGKDVFAALFSHAGYSLKPAIGVRTGFGPADGQWIIQTSGDGTCEGANSDIYGYGCSAEFLTK